ncbi:MAG: ribonuclease HII [Kiritimatiellae bacterium]|nr:ribonuclease HII [Kiritimatiellia bacterium]
MSKGDFHLLEFERAAWAKGFVRVAGVDEVGRGPLAGPVIAAAVIIDREFLEGEEHGLLAGLTDSKELNESSRRRFFDLLTDSPHVQTGIGAAETTEIDRLNILRATHLAMARAVRALSPLPDHVLVDGYPVAGIPCPSTAIVRGDARSLSIAAASVIAKVIRDAFMQEMDRFYPQYGFARHKGYGSREHIRALLQYGPSPVHRGSFRPVREAAEIHARSADLENRESDRDSRPPSGSR